MRTSNTDKRKRGLAAMEMALMLPIFLLLLMGTMDIARLFWTRSVVRDAAFEGARVAIVNETTTAQIETTIERELKAGGVVQASVIAIGAREPAQPVDVTVTVNFDFLVLGNLLPSLEPSTDVSATAVMTHER